MFVSLFQIRRQHMFDPFHECADSARQIAPVCYDEGHGERPATKIGYDLHKRSTLQVSANPPEWRLNQAKAGEGSSFVGLRAVDVQRTWQIKRRVAVAVRIFPSIGSCAQHRRKMNCPMFLTLEIFYSENLDRSVTHHDPECRWGIERDCCGRRAVA